MSNSPSIRSVELQTPIQYLQGIGPDRAPLLAKLGLTTVQDLVFFFPRDYLDLSEHRSLETLTPQSPVRVTVVVEEMEARVSASGRHILAVLFSQDGKFCRGVWFEQPFMQQKFRRGQRVILAGAPRKKGTYFEFVHPRVTWINESADREEPVGEIVPVYGLTEGIRQHQMRRFVRRALEQLIDRIPESLPAEFLAAQELMSLREALLEVHIPSCSAKLQQARYRLVYQELFVMQVALAIRQRQLAARSKAIPLERTTRLDARIRRLFPYSLTEDQNAAIEEIVADLQQDVPMNRLLQGDVGTGKTAVAAYALLLAAAHRCQAILLAPTEILARQHYDTLGRLLAKSHVRIRFLAGGISERIRSQIVEELKQGDVDLLIGTQAILQPDLQFTRLALVIIDEQHKFGVLQRALLRQGEVDPHYLVMTATPIPRTVAMTEFGDLDVSAIRRGPPGRAGVQTYVGTDALRSRWWDFVRRKLREGQQAYVISPLVQAGEDDRPSAEALKAQLSSRELREFRVDWLHGRMTTEEKTTAMERFLEGETQVLVATSVVEVGVDVPNANLMTIEGAERFGLSQLHQLRGRVGRGTQPGFVCVFPHQTSPESDRRLQAFAQTNDGFELAEIDFEIRGPGELFGTRQHGIPPLMVADLRRDGDILRRARADAQALIAQMPDLDHSDWQRFRRMVFSRYGKSLELSDVG